MKKQKGNSVIGGLIFIVLFVFGAICYGFNIYKLCFVDDWKAPYRAEAIHTAGVFIPVISPVTVWADDSK